MANTNKKYSSINDQAAQQLRNNQNVLEILTKMDQALNSNDSFVTVKTVDGAGNEVNSQIPTLGYFKQKLDQLTKMVKVLSGVDGNPAALQIADNQFKRIVIADLNLEPKPVAALPPVSVFKTDPNWIFDSFLNPKISVEIDLTDKISEDTRTIQSKRFIVEFEQILTVDAAGNESVELTATGAIRKKEFEDLYKGKSNIDIVQFVTWLDSPGLVNRVDDNLIDEDYFRIEPNRLQYKGDFTVLSTDIDTVNRKLWYVLDTLTYYDISDTLNPPRPIELKVGDYVNVNPNLADVKSTTVYKVIEISTITSEFRVRFEAVYGEEPIPVRLNALSIYSNKVNKRTVRVSVGFDEYCVLFVKQIDDINNLVGMDWSPGVGFWTSELRLDNENGELFSDYYITKVNDYGAAIEDLVAKKVPNYYGIKPAAPVLDQNNFKVVQVNAHLTQTVEAEQIRDLHNQKNDLTSQIQQVQNAITKQNTLIQTTSFNSDADKKQATDQLNALSNKLATINQNKFSVVQNILASKKNLNKISPIYHARGFFPMPPATTSTKTKPQEVVQFEIWYRKMSKSGSENPILTIPDLNNDAARTASSTNTLTTTNISKPKTVNGAFSNWTKYKTDARKRSQDPITGEWLWQIEDVSDANTPNINQLDIVIQPGEVIEVKVVSLSEVGWPETPIESDFSNTIQIEFPDDLNNVLNDDQFILSSAQADELKVQFQSDLDARGLGQHLDSAIRDVDLYFAHRPEAIFSGFKDSTGKFINLYDQLLLMVNKINTLEETINNAKGILEVYLVNRSNRTRIFNGNNLTFNLNLEDYMTKTKIGLLSAPVDSTARTYKNEVIAINDFSLLILNSATSASLGLLSYRGYGQPAGLSPSTFAYDGMSLTTNTRGIQPIWITADSTIQQSEIPSNATPVLPSAAPRYATQQNNQWLWLEVRDINGNDIYDSDTTQPANDFWDSTVLDNGASKIHKTLITTGYNLGFLTGTTNNTLTPGSNPINQINNSINWQINEDILNGATIFGNMGTTIHPVINGFSDIVDTSSQLTKLIKSGDTNAILIPLYIYAKPYTGSGVYTNFPTPNVNVQFIDTADRSSTGDMPTIAATNNIKRATNNQLILQLDNTSENVIAVGDRIIVNGFTNANTLAANNVIMKVVANVGSTIQLDFLAPGLTTSFVTDGGTLQIIQLHKRYKRTSGGPELYAFNVYGRLSGDDRYVTNYLEIVTSNTTPTPIVHNKKLRFFLEDQNSPRPFEVQINFNITQYKTTSMTFTTNNIQTQLST